VSGLRVLVVAPYYPPHVGGVERYSWELDAELAASPEIERVTVLAPRLPGSAPEREGERHAIVRFPAIEAVTNYPVPAIWSPRFWRMLRGQARSHDVVVCHTRFFLTSLLALALARAAGRPLIHIEHGSDFVQLAGSWTGRAALLYDRTLGRLVLRKANAVFAVSKAAVDFVQRLAGRGDAQVLRRGVEPEQFDPIEPSAELGERAAVTFVGRLLDSKGVGDLIDAFDRLERDDAALFIVGEGPARERLERRAGPSVRFLGARSWTDTVAILKASEVVANPSYTEGLPTAVLEAALAGRAIVATDVGGTSEVVTDGESGLLVAPRDPARLAEALERLLGDAALRARLGERARADVLAGFGWDVSVERFLDVARRLGGLHRQ
jgi:glycosyltransferase involved in cell wall biosynthesis